VVRKKKVPGVCVSFCSMDFHFSENLGGLGTVFGRIKVPCFIPYLMRGSLYLKSYNAHSF